jgi:hypothetical protein
VLHAIPSVFSHWFIWIWFWIYDENFYVAKRVKRGSPDISIFVRATYWLYVRYVVSFNFLLFYFDLLTNRPCRAVTWACIAFSVSFYLTDWKAAVDHRRSVHTSLYYQENACWTKTPWPESASELYRPSDRCLSAKLVQTFADRGVSRSQRGISPTAVF